LHGGGGGLADTRLYHGGTDAWQVVKAAGLMVFALAVNFGISLAFVSRYVSMIWQGVLVTVLCQCASTSALGFFGGTALNLVLDSTVLDVMYTLGPKEVGDHATGASAAFFRAVTSPLLEFRLASTSEVALRATLATAAATYAGVSAARERIIGPRTEERPHWYDPLDADGSTVGPNWKLWLSAAIICRLCMISFEFFTRFQSGLHSGGGSVLSGCASMFRHSMRRVFAGFCSSLVVMYVWCQRWIKHDDPADNFDYQLPAAMLFGLCAVVLDIQDDESRLIHIFSTAQRSLTETEKRTCKYAIALLGVLLSWFIILPALAYFGSAVYTQAMCLAEHKQPFSWHSKESGGSPPYCPKARFYERLWGMSESRKQDNQKLLWQAFKPIILFIGTVCVEPVLKALGVGKDRIDELKRYCEKCVPFLNVVFTGVNLLNRARIGEEIVNRRIRGKVIATATRATGTIGAAVTLNPAVALAAEAAAQGAEAAADGFQARDDIHRKATAVAIDDPDYEEQRRKDAEKLIRATDESTDSVISKFKSAAEVGGDAIRIARQQRKLKSGAEPPAEPESETLAEPEPEPENTSGASADVSTLKVEPVPNAPSLSNRTVPRQSSVDVVAAITALGVTVENASPSTIARQISIAMNTSPNLSELTKFLEKHKCAAVLPSLVALGVERVYDIVDPSSGLDKQHIEGEFPGLEVKHLERKRFISAVATLQRSTAGLAMEYMWADAGDYLGSFGKALAKMNTLRWAGGTVDDTIRGLEKELKARQTNAVRSVRVRTKSTQSATWVEEDPKFSTPAEALVFMHEKKRKAVSEFLHKI
jgi:hypothetical protein